MSVRWLTAFVDRPAATFDVAVAFWLAVTGGTLSPVRGEHGQFATLVPTVGDADVRVQRVGHGPGGGHLDVHVDDVGQELGRAVSLGARHVGRDGGAAVMRSPAGLGWCLVSHHGESSAPPATELPGGAMVSVCRVRLVVPSDQLDDERRFWSAMTGWTPSVDAGWSLTGPPTLPLHLVLESSDGAASGIHLDVSSTDVSEAVEGLASLGATVTATSEGGVELLDPSGHEFRLVPDGPAEGAGHLT